MIKCSKCGFENEDDSLFCSSCGSSLQKETEMKHEAEEEYECPRCRNRFTGKQKFCNKCGLEFTWPEGDLSAMPIKTHNRKRNKSSEKTENDKVNFSIFDYGFHGLSIVAVILAIIAVWLPCSKIFGVAVSSTGCEYWFDEFWSTSFYERYVGNLTFILFIIGGLSAVGFGILTIVKSVKNMLKKEAFDSGLFLMLAVVPTLIYMSTYYAMMYMAIKGTALVSFGSGYILALLGTCFAILVVVGNKVYKLMVNKDKNFVSLILKALPLVFSTVAITIASLSAIRNSLGAETTITQLLPSILKGTKFTANQEIFGVFTFVFYAVSFLFLGCSLVWYTLRNTEKNNKWNLVLHSLGFVAAIGTMVFLILFNGELKTPYDLSYSTIVVCVLMGLSLVSVVVDAILRKIAKN